MPPITTRLTLSDHGAEAVPGAASSCLAALAHLAADIPAGPGRRLTHSPWLSGLLVPGGPLHAVVAARLGPAARPVRAVMFDKTPAANWSLGWHQDRTVAVRERRAVSGYGPWTVKQGIRHVEPPFAVIEAMLTIRVHLDAVPADNAPLLVAPGSHRLGRIPEADIAAIVDRCGTTACLAGPGDVWIYATPILHASGASRAHPHRRVLQVDYAARDLEGGLEWLGL